MAELCLAVKNAGWPILIHCQGDAAIDDALNAIEEAYGRNPAIGLNRVASLEELKASGYLAA